MADGRVDLAASCTGIVNPKSRLSLGDRLGAGDAIVFLASDEAAYVSGQNICVNGAHTVA